MNLLQQTSRVALAALMHDLGKLAERARVETSVNDIDGNKNTYCPKTPPDKGARHTHIHAAYTGLAWDELEKTGHFPDLKKGCEPFKDAEAGGAFPDSAVNAAAAHHRPETFLQWIIATADRVASGFERDEFDDKYNSQEERPNHYRARLLTLFEQIGKGEIKEDDIQWRYPLKPLTPQALFPKDKKDCTPADNESAQEEYKTLWNALLDGLVTIPKSHRNNLPLWLDHFDALWLTITHAIPAATAFGVKPEVSLYDHSKATATLATALWRWHHKHQYETAESINDRSGWDENKFLLVQGDFFGIQNFIFAEGGKTNKHAHKLLRGRSFQVALLAECAALKLLDALELPPTSQIINAAGKFLIVAPNTKEAKASIARVRQEFDDWCLRHTYGEIGIGIATTPASCNDFSQKRFSELQKRLFAELEKAKHQRFDLCGSGASLVFADFLDRFDNRAGVCEINGRYPADPQASAKPDRGYSLCQLADDQIRIGEKLTKNARVLITRNADSLPNLSLDYFGWRVAFVPEEEMSGKYGQLANEQTLVRCWDFDLPEADGKTFRGYARRFVNTYVPRWNEDDRTLKAHGKYERLSKDEIGECGGNEIKTLHVLAAEDSAPPRRHSGLEPESSELNELDSRMCGNDKTKWRGEIALVTLKGDVDNLGLLFRQGLQQPTFAKMASLSRQINLFFALWLPWFCEHGSLPSPAGGRGAGGEGVFRNTYTVFAGGDDFFLVGPWKSTIELAGAMQQHFSKYMVNETITFSAGLAMTQPKVPARQLAHAAEAALGKSKEYKSIEKPCHVGANSFAQPGKNRANEFAPAKPEPTKDAATLWGQTVSWQDWNTLMSQRASALDRLLDQAAEHGAPFSSGMIYALLQLAERAELDQPANKQRRPEDSLWRSQLAYRTSRFITDRIKAPDEQRKKERSAFYALVSGELTQAIETHRGAYRLPLSVLLYGRRE